MNRKVKFRKWDSKNNCWYYFHLNQIWSISDFNFQNDNPYNGFIWYQFTGLLDKNGKEIYEGDIVEWKYFNIWQRNEVKYIGDCFMAMMSSFKDDLNELQGISLISKLDCEVIGNIFENPELLNQ